MGKYKEVEIYCKQHPLFKYLGMVTSASFEINLDFYKRIVCSNVMVGISY